MEGRELIRRHKHSMVRFRFFLLHVLVTLHPCIRYFFIQMKLTMCTINHLFTSAQQFITINNRTTCFDWSLSHLQVLICYNYQRAVHTFGIPIVLTLKLFISITINNRTTCFDWSLSHLQVLICYNYQRAVQTFGIPILLTLKPFTIGVPNVCTAL